MEMVKAVCACAGPGHTVVATKSNIMTGVHQWGFFTWFGVLIFTLITAGWWIFIMIGWQLGRHVIGAKYHCTECGAEVEPSQFRM